MQKFANYADEERTKIKNNFKNTFKEQFVVDEIRQYIVDDFCTF